MYKELNINNIDKNRRLQWKLQKTRFSISKALNQFILKNTCNVKFSIMLGDMDRISTYLI